MRLERRIGRIGWSLLLLGCGLMVTQWGCRAPSAALRRAQVQEYPKIPKKVARSMMRAVMGAFHRSMEATPRCNRDQYAGKWRHMIHGMRPLMMSLGSYQLKGFKKQVKPYKRRRRFWSLPGTLRASLTDLEWVATRRIARARRSALRAFKLAKAEMPEARLEEKDGVSKKALRSPKPPRKRVRRAARRRYSSLGLIFPVPGRRIGSDYGWRKSPMSRRWRFHTGVDIGARRGTPILAAAGGVVVRARYMGSCGYGVIIRHRNPAYRRVTTTYCHMSRILVRRKQRVRQGQTIGRIGSTGNSTGPHLHFAVHINRRHVHPRYHFRNR